MKIISLQFKNLNSLKGEFKIDFTSPTLANAGLFAITGPTGAGKSTILDAITLALYSFVPRLGSINKNTIEDMGVMVTNHTNEAFSHLFFEVNETKYKVEWAINTTKNGTWNDIKHKISKFENGSFVPISQNTTQTQRMVLEIIGLNNEQFTKAIVLSQGKFDEFLKAKVNDRYKLLEVITGTQIYRALGIKVFEGLRNIKKIKESLESKIVEIKLLSQDEIDQINKDADSFKEAVKNLRNEVDQLLGLKQTKDNIIRLTGEEIVLGQKYKSLKLRIIDFEPILEKLQMHEGALPLQVDLLQWENAGNEIQNLKRDLRNSNDLIIVKWDEKQALINQLSTEINESVDESDFLAKLDLFYKIIEGFETSIIRLEAKSKGLQDTLITFFNYIPEHNRGSIIPIKDNIDALNKFKTDKDEELKPLQLPGHFNVNNLDGELDTLKIQAVALKDIIKVRKDIEEQNKVILNEKDELFILENRMANLIIEEEKLTGKLELLNASFVLLEEAFNANKALMSLEFYRNKLVKGLECPCCGSKEHPYVENQPIINNQIEIELENIKLEINVNNQAIRVKKDDLIGYGVLKNKKVETLSILENQLAGLVDSCGALCLQAGISKDIEIDILKNKFNEIEHFIENLTKFKSWYETKNPLEGYIMQLENYKLLNDELRSLIQEKNGLFSGASISTFERNLSTGWQNVISQISETRDKISNYTEIIKNKETDYTQQTTSLTNALEANGFTSVNQLKSVLLSDADYKLYKQQGNEINESEVALKTEQDLNKQAIATEKEKDDHSLTLTEVESRISNASLERDNISKQIWELSKNLQTDEANKTKVQATLNELDKIKEELGYYHIINKLIGDEKGNTFNNIVQRLTLRHLFKMTNVRLNTLMDRFQVELGSEGQLDEIWVIDTYMGDERRTINSVAGGERFVISLAMALSLSDMASSNIKIDSLFIDEGFGSLSPDELDNTISMLERMQLENEKTVGIISHVESLKERINTQIVVERLQNGESTLFLQSNGERTKLRV